MKFSEIEPRPKLDITPLLKREREMKTHAGSPESGALCRTTGRLAGENESVTCKRCLHFLKKDGKP